MAAPMSQATFVASAVSAATARGVTDAEALQRIRVEAIDVWQNSLNWSFSGAPRGSSKPN